jgi:hypothetical protein
VCLLFVRFRSNRRVASRAICWLHTHATGGRSRQAESEGVRLGALQTLHISDEAWARPLAAPGPVMS